MRPEPAKFRPDKLLGQRFLTSASVLKKIADSAQLSKNDTVLEVGPGAGALTLALAEKSGRVIAVEKDRRLFDFLESKLMQGKIKNVRLIHGDILKFRISDFGFRISYKVVANIPYYLTSRLIRRFLESEIPPEEMLLMVQKEVAERITARPPKMNLLALSVQAYAVPKLLFTVPKSAFSPRPKVDSALIRIAKIGKEFFKRRGIGESEFFDVLRAAFRGKRKTLENSLAKNLKLPKKDVAETLSALGLSGKRPEMLMLEDWTGLIRLLRPKIRV